MAQNPEHNVAQDFELAPVLNTGRGVNGKLAWYHRRSQELRRVKDLFFQAQTAENIYEDLSVFGRTPQAGCEDLQARVLDGNLPVLVHIPHAGLRVPSEHTRDGHLPQGEQITEDSDLLARVRDAADYGVDHCVQSVWNRANDGAPYVVKNLHSRLTFDPYEHPDSAAQKLHAAYHQLLSETLERILGRFGEALLINLHAHGTPTPATGELQEPVLCLGVNGTQRSKRIEGVLERLRAEGLAAVNERHSGAFVPAGYVGRPEVTAVDCSARKDIYLDADHTPRRTGSYENPGTDEVPEVRLSDLRVAIRRIWLEHEEPGREARRPARRRTGTTPLPGRKTTTRTEDAKEAHDDAAGSDPDSPRRV
ncbi:N-formylglutamate amidohydrolase [Nesterenkonia sp. MY13]|uniref:N-formylglutamate amidohydrolase n=1 Tax=Nesterenkonia sedimenti TaxID=1463632 RepID=A0A7X8YDW0_9MICC|nr:N-formylglutamate amidohydrolase [Nesterenkonia sedimenti]NLS09865.1 N-formylglutamate amidohydrolase [Nesterenkonia sedimenti]